MSGFSYGPTSISGFFEAAMVRLCPAWLLGPNGAATMRAIGQQLDFLADVVTLAVKARFPSRAPDDALAQLGIDRRIIRGPSELPASFAARLHTWWDAHRTEGGPYALAMQLWLYWRSQVAWDFEIVTANGRRHSVDGATGAVVRDTIAPWTGGGDPSLWSQIWVFYTLTPYTVSWADDDGVTFDDGSGNDLVFEVSFEGTLSPEDAELFAAVPREWRAAHIMRVTIVLLYGTGFVYGYPRGVQYGAGRKYGTDTPGRVVVEA